MAYETWLYEKQYKSAMEDLYSDAKKETLNGDAATILQKTLRVISGPKYELAMNIVTIGNVFTVFIRALTQSMTESSIVRWIILEFVINLIMLLEAIGDVAISGPVKAFKYHFRIWPETLCQLLNIPASIWFFKAGNDFQ